MSGGDSFAGGTVETARRALSARLNAAAIESPELDARLLLGAVLNLDLTGLIGSATRQLDATESATLEALARRRLAGEPVARILGVREFWGLPFKLSPATLVPRPDTETLVEAALEFWRAQPLRAPGLRIADLGTGSGAILLALLHELPEADGIGTDISLEALRTARGNAELLGLAKRASFVGCDYAAALSGPFALIVSNPPYISSREIADLTIEVRAHDPRRALDGGADGLDGYRRLIPEASGLLAPGGALLVEVGHGQSDAVAALMAAAGLTNPTPPKRDLSGIRRAVLGRIPPL